MNWFLVALKKYATFSGRARRAEYWYFVLFYLLISLGICLLEWVVGLSGDDRRGPLSLLFDLGLFLPSLAVGVRRLHDIGRSGWWLLIGLVPIVGWLVLLYFLVTEGDRGPNAYGPDPKAS